LRAVDPEHTVELSPLKLASFKLLLHKHLLAKDGAAEREAGGRVQVATPPVAKVLIDKGLLPIKYVKFFVLDEADKLLEPEAEYYTRSILKMVS
jgi:superfamily II DNA/RNA helicase